MKLSKKELLYLQAKESYYAGNPIMEDFEFDELEAELEEIGSPAIEMVGFKTKGVKVSHITPMKSLGKIQFQHNYTPLHEFLLWAAANPNLNDEIEASPKFDGNAVNLIYQNGKLRKAITRGDGVEGQDVTEKLRYRVPNVISIDKRLEIRGEVAIKTETFDKKYGPGTSMDMKNARNFVAGMLGRDNLEKSILDDLDFLGFEIKMDAETWMAHPFDHLEHWGFQKIFRKNYILRDLKTEDQMNQMYQTWIEYRKECPYQLDGWVVKFGNHMRTPEMETEHHPKWALAIKFPAKIGRTKIIDIEWNLGSTGVIIPTGILEPVNLDGSTVQRVSLHNYEWASERDLGVGADIEIIKSGDIIPKVHKIWDTGLMLNAPAEFMGQKVFRDGVHLRVENPELLPQFKALKLHQGMVILGMKGIGPAMAERLVSAGYTDIADIFSVRFNKRELIASGHFVDGRELEILLEIVENIKSIEYWKLLACLKNDGYGKALSKQLVNFICGVDYDFSGLEKELYENFINKENDIWNSLKVLELIMSKKGVEIIKPLPGSNAINKGTFEMTGKPTTHKVKSDFVKDASAKGYIHEGLNKNSNFLVTDDLNSSSSKMSKAKKLGVEIITYDDFVSKYLK